MTAPHANDTDIAIVGMAAHLPGAASVAEYWANLRAGIEAVRPLTEAECLAAGESPARLRQPNYVRAAAPLDRFADFDPAFFGFSPKEAAILDPQHRQFLEVAWEALEDAGHPPEGFPGSVGVFAGCGMGSYFYVNLCSNPDLVRSTGMFLLRHTGNDKDFLSTRVSHVFDLKGPSLAIQTACSTSLVAVHVAVQSLLNRECDMALAGGVTIELPQGRGYLYEEGEILSPDGHCRAFDHRAQGTVFGSGAACVVLRRLKDALADGDHIWAVVKGTAVNNDGAAKAGYLAPSVDGQAACVAEAHGVAGVDAGTIGYVECHGTGTYLGDPIEVAALTQAFRRTTDAAGYCRIGSVKPNIGHLDTAAGAASLIKAALALYHREIPPSLNFEAPNPAIDFDGSPFRVSDRLMPFPALGAPRRAGVNSLGVGGTNAHAVLEEAPERPASGDSDWPFQLLVLSARTKGALETASRNLAAHLRAHPEQPLADVAFTLKEGRRAFEHRRVLVAGSHDQAAALLEGADPRRVGTHRQLEAAEAVFMFPGGGAQHVGMARDLYETEPVFRDWMDRGLELLAARSGTDPRALWLPAGGDEAAAEAALKRPSAQLPLIFLVEYALAQLLMSWGVRPAALIGHSMGENTAACLAGVMSFEDCLGLVLLRGQLFDTVPPGGMLSVPLAEADLRARLTADLDVASVNAPGLCVVSGPDAALTALAGRLAAEGIEAQRIAIDIAAHSRMLEPILARFGDYLRGIRLSPPRIPVISNRTGRPLTDAEATDPAYWVAHLRGTVRFADGIAHLAGPGQVFLEVGPGRALASLAQANGVPSNQVLAALRHPDHAVADDEWFVLTLGRLWALGLPVDWAPIWGEAPRRRVPLPTYPFERQTFFVAPGRPAAAAETPDLPQRIADPARWGWRPVWLPAAAPLAGDVAGGDLGPPQTWLIFADSEGLGDACAARLAAAGHRVVTVRAGDAFARRGERDYTLAPEGGREGYDLLIRDLVARGLAPARIAHFWLVTAAERFRPGSSFFQRNLEQGFWSLLFLAQAVAEENLPRPLHLTCVTTGAARVRDEALPAPEKAAVAGPVQVLPREVPGVTTSLLDVALPPLPPRGRAAALAALAALVLEDMLADPAPSVAVAALRGGRRLALFHRPAPLPDPAPAVAEGAAVMITGGFGGIGLTLAEHLIRTRRARVVLVTRRPLPAPADRDRWLRAHAPEDPVSQRIRAVARLEAAGGQVLTLAADVCNLEDMRAARAAAEAAFGRISAVIHAAGAIDDAPMLGKDPARVEEVLAPKLHGTQVLATVFPDGDIDTLVLFSSSSTVTAPAGQADYVAANAFLNAFAEARASGRTRVVALNWGTWSGVGMAAEALAARTGARAAQPPVAVGLPLLDHAGQDAQGDRLFTAAWRTADRWVLDGHRTAAGQALLPGTGYLELAAEAYAAQGETGPFAIGDLTFFRPLAIGDTETRAVRVRLARSAAGYAFAVQSEAIADGRRGWQTHATAELAPLAGPPPAAMDLAVLAARMAPGEADPTGLRSPQEDHLRFGPRWRVLRATHWGDGEALAHLALPVAFRAADSGLTLHPALLDIATGWAMRLIPGWDAGRLWVPVAYASVRVHRPLPPDVASHVRLVEAGGGAARFDVTLCAPDGAVCVEVGGFALRRLDGTLDLSRRAEARDLAFDPDEARPLTAAEERLRHAIDQGIPPEAGGEAFDRALATGMPRVVVSALELDALVRLGEAEAPASAAGGGAAFARPAGAPEAVAPRNDIERTLAGFWQDLLGVGQVGVEDSFFDLGGHSLIAVRLFAMIRKAFRVDFPISVLFEAPTIAAVAALIADRIGAAPGTGQAAAPGAPARRFTHLVPMHRGEGGPGQPFFLVAGMFGNVLNLRHLAQLLGGDRPFYGVQARGLAEGEDPHRTLPEAAAAIIAEIRAVQPDGPYLLGGFSGGGLTAWEIAQQLTAADQGVTGLVLLDTLLPHRPVPGKIARMRARVQDFRTGGRAELAAWLAWKLGRAAPPPPPEAADPVGAAFLAAQAAYELRPWYGPVALFRPPLDRYLRVAGGRWLSRKREFVAEDNGWSPYAPGLTVVEVPGDHDSMVLEPNVRVLAARLKGWLMQHEPVPEARRAAAE